MTSIWAPRADSPAAKSNTASNPISPRTRPDSSQFKQSATNSPKQAADRASQPSSPFRPSPSRTGSNSVSSKSSTFVYSRWAPENYIPSPPSSPETHRQKSSETPPESITRTSTLSQAGSFQTNQTSINSFDNFAEWNQLKLKLGEKQENFDTIQKLRKQLTQTETQLNFSREVMFKLKFDASHELSAKAEDIKMLHSMIISRDTKIRQLESKLIQLGQQLQASQLQELPRTNLREFIQAMELEIQSLQSKLVRAELTIIRQQTQLKTLIDSDPKKFLDTMKKELRESELEKIELRHENQFVCERFQQMNLEFERIVFDEKEMKIKLEASEIARQRAEQEVETLKADKQNCATKPILTRHYSRDELLDLKISPLSKISPDLSAAPKEIVNQRSNERGAKSGH